MKKTVIAACILLASTLALRGAGTAVQFWEMVGFDWKPVAGLRLDFEKQMRYEDTFAAVESDITEVGIGYDLNKQFTVKADYRFVGMGDEKRQRVDGNIIFKMDWARFSVSNRARLQQESITTLKDSNESRLVFRDRLRLTYRSGGGLEPYVGGEIFLGLNEEGKAENKFRLSSGLDFDLSKRVTLSLFYHFQKDMGEKTNETKHIVAGGFHYSF
jgi:opacity protein-like surface antigen